ncbi:hypothetical protein DFJ74DRAFT_36877 [Hyaloraphidium curvatum]|nr:hypothetical protein DFJ74DRAFT_36877 [Hyaloraphidium curvatum]
MRGSNRRRGNNAVPAFRTPANMPCGKFAAAGSPRATASVVYDAAERKPMEITDMGRHASRKHHRISARLPFTLYYAALALALLWLSVCCTVTDAAPALVFLGTGFSLNASTRLWDRQTRCPSGQTSCGGSCVNLQTSANHCGSCANECLQVPYPNQQIWCSGGECQSRCVIPTCDPGEILAYGRQNPCAFCRPCENTLLYNCGSSTEVGQHNCVNRNTDNRNCGSCGNACPFSTMVILIKPIITRPTK